MSRPIKLDANGLRPRTSWPRLTDEQQTTLREFLAWWRVQCEYGAQRSGELAAIATEDTGQAKVAEWWAHAVRAIDFLLSKVGQRQQYLEIQAAMKEKRWKDKVTEPGT
jgi:hypothetical protein